MWNETSDENRFRSSANINGKSSEFLAESLNVNKQFDEEISVAFCVPKEILIKTV